MNENKRHRLCTARSQLLYLSYVLEHTAKIRGTQRDKVLILIEDILVEIRQLVNVQLVDINFDPHLGDRSGKISEILDLLSFIIASPPESPMYS